MAFTEEQKKDYDNFVNDLDNSIFAMKGYTSSSLTPKGTADYLNNKNRKKPYRIMLIIHGKSGVLLGADSWIASDEEVLFDKKIRFRALKPEEPGYIKLEEKDGVLYIHITEV